MDGVAGDLWDIALSGWMSTTLVLFVAPFVCACRGISAMRDGSCFWMERTVDAQINAKTWITEDLFLWYAQNINVTDGLFVLPYEYCDQAYLVVCMGRRFWGDHCSLACRLLNKSEYVK